MTLRAYTCVRCGTRRDLDPAAFTPGEPHPACRECGGTLRKARPGDSHPPQKPFPAQKTPPPDPADTEPPFATDDQPPTHVGGRPVFDPEKMRIARKG